MQNEKFLLLPTFNSVEAIDINTIIRIQACSNYSKLFFTTGKTLVVAKVLQWFDLYFSSLPGEDRNGPFLRIHRAHLINSTFIRQYIRGEGGKIVLVNGEMVDVSKRKKSSFLQRWSAAA
jgi:two-component system, LytTR family, response regulator